VLAEAMSKDFGFRAPAESKMLDLLGSMLEANHAIGGRSLWLTAGSATFRHWCWRGTKKAWHSSRE